MPSNRVRPPGCRCVAGKGAGRLRGFAAVRGSAREQREPHPVMDEPSGQPVHSVADAIARMEAISAALPPTDGMACFNRMYLDVTRQVNASITQGFFADPGFMAQLDVTFANMY